MQARAMKLVTAWLGFLGVLVVGLAVLLMTTGCGGPPKRDPTSRAQIPSHQYTNAPDADVLYAGNRITIVFHGIPNPPDPHVEQIRNDGFISPPLLDPLKPVKAAGLTIAQLQQELQARYVPGFFKNITITVRNEERYFFVGGDVRNPGQKPYLSEMTVVKAIQAAGDFTEFANRSRVQITRTDGTKEEVDVKAAIRDPKLDRPVYPGDTIFVPRGLL